MPHRLQNESSPYLLQHGNNPVDWYRWGHEALARSRDEEKPIFLSVGYSACHVMKHESFENDAIAKLLNDNFVSIKVDREERSGFESVTLFECENHACQLPSIGVENIAARIDVIGQQAQV